LLNEIDVGGEGVIVGFNIDIQSEKKETPLHKAIRLNNLEAATILLKNKANFHIKNGYNFVESLSHTQS
jgi:ankyrin repeat protein